jgi:regulatory protein
VARTELPEISQAKRYAFLLLKYRQRSTEELRHRLGKKGFSAEVVEPLLAWLTEKRFLDDRQFAFDWMRQRLGSSFGRRRVALELRRKGISAGLIEQAGQEVSREHDEGSMVREMVARKMKVYRNLEPQVAKRRLYGFLLRRGFSPEVIMEAMEKI